MFFFQAEDGIRDLTVTGVQTCALPIPAFASRRWSPWCSRASSCRSTPRRFRTPSRCPSITCSIPPIITGTAAAPRSAARSWSFARSPSGIATSGAPPPGCSLPSIGCVPGLPMSEAERALGALLAVMARLPRALPALVRAAKLGHRAAGVGFDWPDAREVRAKVLEELHEMDGALAAGEAGEAGCDAGVVADELGDLLFSIVNWSRHLMLDAEAALRAANAKFERRFATMESLEIGRASCRERV